MSELIFGLSVLVLGSIAIGCKVAIRRIAELEAEIEALRAVPDAEALARAYHEVYWLGPGGDGTCTWDGRRLEDRAAEVERMRQALARAALAKATS